MLFSILVANFNNGKYFNDCYQSIIAQRYTNWEVVIVDDRSTDDSVQQIKKLTGNDARFRFFENDQNKGCGFTKSKCMEYAKGDICAYLDPDDAIVPEALQVMVQAHAAHPEISLAHSTFFYCDESLTTTGIFDIAKRVQISNQFTNLDGSVTHFVSFKKQAYLQTGGIDKLLKRAVDQDLYLKLSEQGPFFFIPEPLYKYRIHKDGISTANSTKAFYCHLKVIGKAEERRNVSMEEEVCIYLNRKANNGFLETNLANPRYLAGKFIQGFKKDPGKFLKKIFRK